MKALKDLYEAGTVLLKHVPALSQEPIGNVFVERLDAAQTFLNTNKAFSYDGDVTISGAAIKLVDSKMDLDDVLRAMCAQLNAPIKCQLYIVVAIKT